MERATLNHPLGKLSTPKPHDRRVGLRGSDAKTNAPADLIHWLYQLDCCNVGPTRLSRKSQATEPDTFVAESTLTGRPRRVKQTKSDPANQLKGCPGFRCQGHISESLRLSVGAGRKSNDGNTSSDEDERTDDGDLIGHALSLQARMPVCADYSLSIETE